MGYRLLVILLGATVWVGGHLVLCLSVLRRALRTRDPAPVREFEGGFVPHLDAPCLPALAWHIVAVTVIAVLIVGVGIRTGGLW